MLLAVMPLFLAGCPYMPPETKNPHLTLTEPVTKNRYHVYVPSYYSDDSDWPVVVTLVFFTATTAIASGVSVTGQHNTTSRSERQALLVAEAGQHQGGRKNN